MATRKPNRNQVNRVPHKSDEQDITLGSRSSLPEDETKSVRKHGNKIEVRHASHVSLGEQENIRKGRTPAKPKPKKSYDRHAPRKSEIEKQYTYELAKIRARLRYREKQGFFVKWETLPSRPMRATQRSIEKLQQYQVQLNDMGEIELKRLKYGEEARQLRITRQQRPNYTIENDPNFVPPMETVQHFDVFKRIERTLLEDIDIVSTEGLQLEHTIEETKWVELSNACELAYREALDKFRALRDSSRRQEYADYLVAHEDEVTDAIETVMYASTQDLLASAKESMLRYLDIH